MRSFFTICGIFQNEPKTSFEWTEKWQRKKSHRWASEKTDEHKLMRRKKRMSENRWAEKLKMSKTVMSAFFTPDGQLQLLWVRVYLPHVSRERKERHETLLLKENFQPRILNKVLFSCQDITFFRSESQRDVHRAKSLEEFCKMYVNGKVSAPRMLKIKVGICVCFLF